MFNRSELRKSNAKISIVLTTVDDPSQFGIAEVKNNTIKKFMEKATILFDKFKNGEQLTTEDLLILQKAGLL